MSAIQRRGVLLDGIGAELVRSANGGRRKTLSQWMALIVNLGSTAITAVMAPLIQAATKAAGWAFFAPGNARTSHHGTNDAALAAAKTAAGVGGVIIVDNALVLTSTATTAGYTLRFEGGTISPPASSATLTVGDIEASPLAIFTGANIARVRFSKPISYHLEWFGTAGDGIADDSAALTAALTAVAASGGKMLSSADSTFSVSAPVEIGDGTSTTLSTKCALRWTSESGGGVGEGEIGPPRGGPRIVYNGTAPAAKTITGATRANPCVVTSAAHGFTNGQTILVSHVGGMVELNGKSFTVANVTTNTFELSGINSSAFTVYTSGGVAILEVPVVRVNGPYHSLDLSALVIDTNNKATVGIKALLPYNAHVENVAVENLPAYGRGIRVNAYAAPLPYGFTQGAMHGKFERCRVRAHRSDNVFCSIEFSGDDANNVGCSRWDVEDCDFLIGGAAGTYGIVLGVCDKINFKGGMTAWRGATQNGNGVGMIGSVTNPGFPHECDTSLTTIQGGWAIISGTPGSNTSDPYPTNDGAPIPAPALNVFGMTSDGRWFGPARQFIFGLATAAADLLSWRPSDYGTNKPGLFLAKSSTAGRYELKTYDGTDNNGEVSLQANTKIELNSTTEVELNTTLVDLNGNLDVSGTSLLTGIVTTGGAINLGHASDTTLARVSAGVLSVEGNVIYAAGGTDVPVADGGTGSSTAAGAATNLGLGTGDSPQFAAINLGHASDTTLSRSAAGKLAVEGVDVILASGAQTIAGLKTFSNSLTYFESGGDNTGLQGDASGTHIWSLTRQTNGVKLCSFSQVDFYVGSTTGVGTGTKAATIDSGGGLILGAPTGGAKGLGTLNLAADVYKNNTAYTNPDYVFELAYRGEIVQFADKPGAASYAGPLSLDDLDAYTRATLRLPGITDDPMGMFERGDKALEKLEELTLYVIELHKRLKAVESSATGARRVR